MCSIISWCSHSLFLHPHPEPHSQAWWALCVSVIFFFLYTSWELFGFWDTVQWTQSSVENISFTYLFQRGKFWDVYLFRSTSKTAKFSAQALPVIRKILFWDQQVMKFDGVFQFSRLSIWQSSLHKIQNLLWVSRAIIMIILNIYKML